MAVDGQRVPLKALSGKVRIEIQQHLSASTVVRRVRFFRSSGEELEPYALIPDSSYLLLSDGRLCKWAWPDSAKEAAGDLGLLFSECALEAFNERGCRMAYAPMRALPETFRFLVDGQAVQPLEIGAESVRLELELVAMENAAGECEALEFACYVRLGEDLRVDLQAECRLLLEPMLHAYGGSLLSAKRRVRALCDLMRRLLAAGVTAAALDLDPYVEDYPELFDYVYRYAVVGTLQAVLQNLEEARDPPLALAVDPVARRWLSYPMESRQLAMLLYSLSDVSSRNDLQALLEGAIPVSRRMGPADEVQRILSVCANLGVRVRYNAQPIRFEPLSISVATRAQGTDIDWFALHPSIRCGERSIGPDEWQQLIRGKLLLEDAAVAWWCRRSAMLQGEGWTPWPSCCGSGNRPERAVGEPAEDGLRVSRLEMLDWILLRQHGVQLNLPAEAEALFKSLTEFSGLGEFAVPEGVRAELRPYQQAGCAWIDFLYRHRLGACLADDMGLGKTVQAIAFLHHRFNQGLGGAGAAALIVLPPSLVFNWLDEFARFAPALQVVDCLKKADWPRA